MDPVALIQRLNLQTCAPFELVLSTGERLPARHPERLVVTRRASILLVYRAEGDSIASDHVLVSNMHIVKVQHLNGARSSRTEPT